MKKLPRRVPGVAFFMFLQCPGKQKIMEPSAPLEEKSRKKSLLEEKQQ